MGLTLFVILRLSVSHLAGWKFINHGLFPFGEPVEVLLQAHCIFLATDSGIQQTDPNKLSSANSLICDVTQSGISLIDVCQKQQRPQHSHSALRDACQD